MSAPDPTLTQVGDTPAPAAAAPSSDRTSRRTHFEEAVLPPLVALAAGDVDGDGVDDLAVAMSSAFLKVFRGKPVLQ